MPRRPRCYLPGIAAHVVQRGNNRHATFFADADYAFYLDCLREAIARYGCALHAYVLMTNHVHLPLTPTGQDGISRAMQCVARRYVPYVNHEYGRTGTLWEGQHKACLVGDARYLLACQRYIELNPVRAGMADAPGRYRWSSYACNAHGRPDSLLRPHASYLALGPDAASREHAYRELFRGCVDDDLLHEIRGATEYGAILGNDRFRKEVEFALGRSLEIRRRGRPRKREDEK